MKGKTLLCTATFVAVLLLPAAGFGDMYGFYGWGRSWPEVGIPGFLKDQLPGIGDVNLNLTYDHFTVGLLYDSAPPREDLFNWRVSLGVDIALARLQGVQGGGAASQTLSGLSDLYAGVFDATGYGFATKFTYAVGLFKLESLRVWVGPSVRLNFNYLAQKTATIQVNSVPVQVDPWALSLAIGGGIEGGVTWQVASDVRADLSAGFHYNVLAYYQNLGLTYGSQPIVQEDSFLWGQEPFAFVQLAAHLDFPQS
jgi:hypothetical protein